MSSIWARVPPVPTGSRSMCRSPSWMWTGTGPLGSMPSWAWATTSPMPPTWSTWPWVVRRATRRSPFSRAGGGSRRGSGGASIEHALAAGPVGGDDPRVGAGQPQPERPRSSSTPPAADRAGRRRRAAVERPGDGPGPGVGHQLLQGHGQGDRPVGPLVDGAGHVGPLRHGQRRRRGWRSAAGTAPAQGAVGGGHGLVRRGVVGHARPVLQPAGTWPRWPPRWAPGPSRRWSSRSEPVHRPATVGRSWVVTAARACSGYSRRRPVLEPQQPVGQDVAGGQLAPGPRPPPCRGPRPRRRRRPGGSPGRRCRAGRRPGSARRRRRWRARPRGIQHRRKRPITWSRRRPPAWRRAARIVSTKGS